MAPSRLVGRLGGSALTFALMAVLLAALAGAEPRLKMPHARVLQQDFADCDFSGTSGTVTTAWVDVLGFSLATPKGLLDCINQVQVSYDFAYESVTNLGQIFNQSYVFVALAANPTYQQSMPSLIYNYSVDVPGELAKLASSWRVNKSVSLGDLQFQVTDIFNRLYDAHVTYAGSGDRASGTILGNAARNLTQLDSSPGTGDGRAYLVDVDSSALLIGLDISRSRSGAYAVRGQFLTVDRRFAYATFDKVNGKDPMEWVVALSNNPAISLPYKPPGTRVNQLLTSFQNFRVNYLGRLDRLTNAKVTYSDGTSGTLAWGITVAPIVYADRLALAQQQANTPGVPYMALLKAAQAYEYGDISVSANPAAEDSPVISSAALPEERERRRRLQSGGDLPSRITYLRDSDGSSYGLYFFNDTKAVLKLSTFSLTLSQMQTWLPGFLTAAKRAGADELIIDLTGNGGGNVVAGVGLALALFPGVKYGDFGLRYDRIMGNDAVFAYANNLQPGWLNATLQVLANNATIMQGRTSYINGNSTEFKRLLRETKAIISALNVLFESVSQDQDQTCTDYKTGYQVSCRSYWRKLSYDFESFVDAIASDGLSLRNLRLLLTSYYPAILRFFWPYTGAPGDGNSDPYAKPQLLTRGGKPRYYTAKFDLLGLGADYTARDFFDNLPSGDKPIFTKILAVSDGYCGSTCDTFSRTAYFYSKRTPSAPVFRYFTFGGTGKVEDSAATAYPGGNVNGNDLLTASWSYSVIGQLTADWLGSPILSDRFYRWSQLLPVFPAMLDNYTPGFTQSEIYQSAALGNASLPVEYVRIPTDYWAPVWFTNTGMPEADTPSDLPALYAAAASIITSMPGPKATSG